MTAEEAWSRAVAFARTLYSPLGFRGDGSLGNEAIDRAVRGIGGYAAISLCDTDKLPALKRRFAVRYEELVDVIEARGRRP